MGFSPIPSSSERLIYVQRTSCAQWVNSKPPRITSYCKNIKKRFYILILLQFRSLLTQLIGFASL